MTQLGYQFYFIYQHHSLGNGFVAGSVGTNSEQQGSVLNLLATLSWVTGGGISSLLVLTCHP